MRAAAGIGHQDLRKLQITPVKSATARAASGDYPGEQAGFVDRSPERRKGIYEKTYERLRSEASEPKCWRWKGTAGLERDPTHLDTIIRRWQALTGGSAHHAANGRSFDDLAREAEAANAA